MLIFKKYFISQGIQNYKENTHTSDGQENRSLSSEGD